MEREKSFSKTLKAIDKLTKQVSEITDTLGKYVEEQVRPRAISEFKKFGIILHDMSCTSV
ncbi:MAG: hypothetical protein NW207_07000 [Cytophagales bacterium]|nr:hypothetical protein [Cytophagales bacterium]